MKKFLYLLAMLFIIAGLMATQTSTGTVVSQFNQNADQARTVREVFYTEDFESGATGWTHWDGAVAPNNWHIYDNGDAQGNVWWMGDPALASGGNIGGYYDHQYLVLDSPVQTITAGNPNLTFKMRMNMEEPGTSGEYNGWDSFNLRISTNAGISWTVIPSTLISLPYDFSSSYAFGSEHGEGPNVPGWGGIHEPWVSITVDLSDYVGSNVKIRFAFASDPAYSTADQLDMYGVMVDDIAFGGYSNNGVDDGQMTWSSLVPTAGDFWHLANVGNDAPSPTHIMTCQNDAGTYVNYMLNYLMSPSITLPGDATQIVADFQLRGTYYDPGTFPDVDYFGWEVSPDDGLTWRYMSNPYADPDTPNYVYSSAPDNWASMITSYGGVTGDITGFAGNTVKFRWYFQSNGTTPQGTPLQIDDFQIFSVTAAPAPVNLVYPLNNQGNLPATGFNLDWAPSSLGAFPEMYTVGVDADMDNLEPDNFIPTYSLEILPVLVGDQWVLYSYCHTSDLAGLTLAAGQTWYWSVVASIAGQPDAFSEIFRFDIGSLVVIDTFPWAEGFENPTFPPADWVVVDVDGGGTTWVENTILNYVHSGDKSAKHGYSDLIPDPGQNGWLITPAISLPMTGIFRLSWWNYNNYPTWMVYNGVKVNTVNDPAAPGWVQLWTQDSPAAAWSNAVIDISSYGGQIVYFAFNYQGYDADDWYIDDVSIFELLSDDIPPTITHLPLINTLRDDITHLVTADVVDDPTWNNPIGGVNLYYSTDGGTTYNPPIPMVSTREGYSGYIPAQTLGTEVTYYIEAWDSEMNYGQTSEYSFWVDDPVWIFYDTGGTGYIGFPDYDWGPLIYYENPLYGTGTPLKILATDGALHNNTAGNGDTAANLHIYTDDGDDLVSIFNLAVNFVHRTYTQFDLSAYNIEINTPWFWIGYQDLGTNRNFLYDATYDYTTLYLMIGTDIYYSTSPGEWCIGALVQSGVAGLEAPVASIAHVGGNSVISWEAVPGAASYNVYIAADPYAADPWTLLTNTAALSYTHTGTVSKEFFKVTADTEPPTRLSPVALTARPTLNAPQITVPQLQIKTDAGKIQRNN